MDIFWNHALLFEHFLKTTKVSCHCVSSQVIEFGGGIRSTGATGVNADSSRSHAILQLQVKVVNTGEHVGRYLYFCTK